GRPFLRDPPLLRELPDEHVEHLARRDLPEAREGVQQARADVHDTVADRKDPAVPRHQIVADPEVQERLEHRHMSDRHALVGRGGGVSRECGWAMPKGRSVSRRTPAWAANRLAAPSAATT